MSNHDTLQTDGRESPDVKVLHALVQRPKMANLASLGPEKLLRKCPSCEQKFDVRLIGQRLDVELPGERIQVCLFMCPDCVRDASLMSGAEFECKLGAAFENVDASEDPTEWATSTDLTIWSHGGDEIAAIVYGCQLSDNAIKDYASGLLDLGFVLSIEEVGR